MPDVGRCRVGIRVVTILDDVLSCEAVVSGQAPLSSLRGDVDKTWARRVITTNTIMLNVEQERARQKKPKKKTKKTIHGEAATGRRLNRWIPAGREWAWRTREAGVCIYDLGGAGRKCCFNREAVLKKGPS